MKAVIKWFKEWKVSKELIIPYLLACLLFKQTPEGFLQANILYHSVMTPIFAFSVIIEFAQRRFTNRRYMDID
jgi:hypothetical protein